MKCRRGYTTVLEICVRIMRHRKLDDSIETAVGIWETYIRYCPRRIPTFSKSRRWDAALEALALQPNGQKPDTGAILRWHTGQMQS